jgi:chromate transporter
MRSDDAQAPRAAAPRATLSRLTLFWEFLKIGALGVGDTGPLLAFIERDLVEARHVLTHEDVNEALTYTKPLPGSTVVQIAAYVGYKIGGWPGSTIATWAYLLPSIVLMLVLAAGYVVSTAIPLAGPAVQGVTAAVVGILLATAYRLGRRNVSRAEPVNIAIAVATFLVGVFLNINVALIVVVAGLLGILLMSPPAKVPKSAGGGKP